MAAVPLTSSVLAWAVAESGRTPGEIADHLDVHTSDLQAWIAEEKQPNKTQLSKLARLLGRPESFFFLPQPPTAATVQATFRTYNGAGAPTRPTAGTAQALQLARRAQKVAAWIHERLDSAPVAVPTAKRREDPEKVGARLRAWLGWSVQNQTAETSTDTSAAKALRGALQDQGLLVLHLTLDEGVTRGFSLAHELAPLVAVNTRDHVRARLFSYGHELAHLALRDNSVCLSRSDQAVERFCNQVSAALLMPEEEFSTFVKTKLAGRVRDRANAVKVRNHFRVSLPAAAIRAETLGLASAGLYESVVADVEIKGRGGRYEPGNERTRPRVRVDQYGQAFVSTLLEAEDAGVLRRPQLLSLLRVSDGELHAVRELTAVGVG